MDQHTLRYFLRLGRTFFGGLSLFWWAPPGAKGHGGAVKRWSWNIMFAGFGFGGWCHPVLRGTSDNEGMVVVTRAQMMEKYTGNYSNKFIK